MYTQLLAFVKGYLRIGFVLFLGIGIVDAMVGIVSGYLSIDHFAELLSKVFSVDCFPAVNEENLPHFIGIAVNLFIGAYCSELLRGKASQFEKNWEVLSKRANRKKAGNIASFLICTFRIQIVHCVLYNYGMKKITEREYKEFQKYQKDRNSGRLITATLLDMICRANENDPEKIGKDILEIVAKQRREESV